MLMKEVPCEDIVASYLGGFSKRRFQTLTVVSLEAESMKAGLGKATARTYTISVRRTLSKKADAERVRRLRALRAKQRA